MGADKSTFEFDCWMYSLKFSFVAFLVERTQNEDKTTFKSPTAIPPPGVKPCPPKKFRPFLGSSDIAEGLVCTNESEIFNFYKILWTKGDNF